MKYVVVKEEIREKFDKFVDDGRILFFSAACGFGKTTVAKELLRAKSVREFDAKEDIESEATERYNFILVDDIQDFVGNDIQQKMTEMIRKNPKKRFCFLSRGEVPAWLIPFEISGLLTEIRFNELLLSRAETAVLFKKSGINLSETVLTSIHKDTLGYPLLLSLIVKNLKKGMAYDDTLMSEVVEELFLYYEEAVFNRFDMPVRRFLLSLAVFEEFNPELAKIVSGDSQAPQKLTSLYRNSNMIEVRKKDSYCFWRIFREFLMWKQEKEYTEKQISSIYSRGGLYYELHENYGKALEFYSKSGERSKVSELIIKSMYLHPGMGHYEELEAYFELLPEEQILESPALMQGMSMIRSLQGNYDESEKWYNELKLFADVRSKSDNAAKEARSRLVFLDISLPQRGVENIAQMITTAANMIANKEIKQYTFSVTSALPSIMNGGKDFSKWSKTDDLLYATMRKPVELLLGKDGVGLADCSIAESKFEKGIDNRSKILELVSRLSEIQHNGTPDIEFAVVGLIARSQIFSGSAESAYNTLNSLKSRFQEQNYTRFLANIDAMLCRIALRMGDMSYAEEWYREKAPKDAVTIRIMKRYLYLTQAMTEITFGNNNAALITLAPLERPFDICGRHIDMIHMKTLSAIAKYRSDDSEWKKDINRAIDISAEYGFIRTVSGYGAAVLPLVEECGSECGKKFLDKLIKAVRVQAVCYPNFLIPVSYRYAERLSDAELQVLKLLCADKSNAEICDILNIRVTTVKSHISHILQKLGAKRRAEAKTIAQNLKIV